MICVEDKRYDCDYESCGLDNCPYRRARAKADSFDAVKKLFNELPASTVSHLCSVLYPIKKLEGMDVYTNHTLYKEFKKILEGS